MDKTFLGQRSKNNFHNPPKHIHYKTHKFFSPVSSIHPNGVQTLYLIARIMNSFQDKFCSAGALEDLQM
jgi:hypothetical protein